AFGSTLGGENATFMRNLWANNAARNPSIGWNGIFNFANNVVYNWVHRAIDGGDYTAQYNIMNNYFKPGPATPAGEPISYRLLKPEAGRSKLPYVVFGRAYVEGNIVDGNAAVTTDNWNGGVQIENKQGNLMSFEEATPYFAAMRSNKPFPHAAFTLTSAEEAYEHVLANAGATLPKRDPVDLRVIKEVRDGKPTPLAEKDVKYPEVDFEHRRLPKDSYKVGIITDISQVGGYPEYKGKPYKDADNDGIPDDAEVKMGLDPKNPNDAAEITESGYANIEIYLNNLASKG